MSGRPDAGERLRRLLALIPWLAERGGASLDEIARRFELPPEEMRRELELVACCGLPPYSPDMLIELIVDEDSVSARIPHYFSKPLRLTAPDGLALLAAGRALLAVPGAEHGALASALDKLEQVVGEGGRLSIDLEAPPHLAEVRRAAEEHVRLEVDYYSAWRDEMSTRQIDPLVVFSADGRWYVVAHDHLTGEERRFRVDRIRRLDVTAETFEPREVDPRIDDPFTPGASAEVVTLLLPPEARWVTESYPVRDVSEEPDGRLRVVLTVLGLPWLERLLLRVGARAEVVDPPHLADVGREAAARLLAAYA
jgi:proteasome accessory factor C